MKKTILTILLIILVAGVSGGGVWWWQKGNWEKEKGKLEKEIENLKIEIGTSNDIEEITEKDNNQYSNWKIYRDDTYGYEVKYPSAGDLQLIYPSSGAEKHTTIAVGYKSISLSINIWENKENYKNLEELIAGEKEIRSEGYFSVFPYLFFGSERKVRINGLDALKRDFYIRDGIKEAVKDAIVFGGKNYYYISYITQYDGES